MNTAAGLPARHQIGVRRGFLDEVVRPLVRELPQPVARTFNIAGRTVRFRYYGALVAERMSRALAHLQADASAVPELTVHLWDSVSAGLAPPRPWAQPDHVYDPLGAPPDEAFHGVYVPGEESASLYDVAAGEGYVWLTDVNRIPGWVLAAPARVLLQWFLRGGGVHLVHGAVVGSEGRAALITAKGGSGKSTTAFSCAAAGLDYLADDYCGIALGQTPMAYSIFNSSKLTPRSLEAFPEARRFVGDLAIGDNDKSIVYMSDAAPSQLRRQAPLMGILVPVIGKAAYTHLLPAPRRQAFLALAPSTIFQSALAGAAPLAPLKDMVERLPCHFLMLGPDMREVAVGVQAYLRGVKA